MKLAEAKRRTKVGTVIDAVGHYNPNASGLRTVTKVQSNGFWFASSALCRGWCAWPPASLVRDDGPDTITLMIDQDGPLSTFTYPPEDDS